MANLSKQDRQGVRTPADIERKYNFGKSFAEVTGIATDARTAAEQAQKATEKLDATLTPEELFNRLTNNGQAQGLFRDDKGQIYINAEYIVAIAEMFAKDITMSGTLTNTVDAFLEPGQEEIEVMQNHILGNVTIPATLIPSYDFNNDGAVTAVDLRMAQKAMMGTASLAEWAGAKKTTVTLTIDLSDPERAITITGTNMWGREINEYVGANGTSLRHRESADYVVEEGTETSGGADWRYRKWNSGYVELWAVSQHTHPANSGTEQIVCTITYPFMVRSPICFCQGAGYTWNLARPIYIQAFGTSLTMYLYPRTDMAGSIYTVNTQIVGYWK